MHLGGNCPWVPLTGFLLDATGNTLSSYFSDYTANVKEQCLPRDHFSHRL